MNPKYAILLDGAFVQKKLKERLHRTITAGDIENECNVIIAHTALNNSHLLRIYFYDAPPASQKVRNPLDNSIVELASTHIYRQANQLLDTLELKPNFALRSGKAVSQGWKLGKSALRSLVASPRNLAANDLVPNIKQKGVDLRIGLDIARLSLLHLVNVIVVVTGDSDLVPAFKFARREGLRVYLYDMGHGVHRDLKAHVDLTL